MKIVLATNNAHKVREIRKMFENTDIEILSLGDISFDGDTEEYGRTFEENSLIKAMAVSSLGYIALADDSGICVDALDGRPGIFSARYASEKCDDQANRDKMLEEMKDIRDEEKRGAKYICAMSLVLPENSTVTIPEKYRPSVEACSFLSLEPKRAACALGECCGRITEKEMGHNGFGYDYIFYSYDVGKCFGIASDEEKASVSHRARAVTKMTDIIREVFLTETEK